MGFSSSCVLLWVFPFLFLSVLLWAVLFRVFLSLVLLCVLLPVPLPQALLPASRPAQRSPASSGPAASSGSGGRRSRTNDRPRCAWAPSACVRGACSSTTAAAVGPRTPHASRNGGGAPVGRRRPATDAPAGSRRRSGCARQARRGLTRALRERRLRASPARQAPAADPATGACWRWWTSLSRTLMRSRPPQSTIHNPAAEWRHPAQRTRGWRPSTRRFAEFRYGSAGWTLDVSAARRPARASALSPCTGRRRRRAGWVGGCLRCRWRGSWRGRRA